MKHKHSNFWVHYYCRSCLFYLGTAKLYDKLMDQHNFSCNYISLTWNTNGIPVFESSQYSIWPIQSAINELPPYLRRKHILIHELWFGNKKPAMNTFLKPLTEEYKLLETNGFILEKVMMSQ